MTAVLTMAWRNLWRRPRRTALTVITVSLGLGLLLVSIGLGDGAHYQMIDMAVRMGSGHVLIQSRGFQQEGGVEKFLAPPDQREVRRWLGEAPERPVRVLARTFASGLAASAEDAAGVQIIGIEPDREREASVFAHKLIEGSFPEAADSDHVVVGEGIARKLDLTVGDKLVLMAQPARGAELQSMLVHVGAVVRTGLEEFDQTLVLLPLERAQKFFGMDGGVHQVAVLLDDSRLSDRLAHFGRESLPGLEVLSWAEALPELRDFILVDDAGNYLFNAVFFLLIAFLVLNTLLMSVLERNREFALLDALGLSPAGRFAMVLLEGALIAALAAAGGLALGYGGHLYLATHGLPMDLFYEGELTAAGVAFDPVIYSFLSVNRIVGCVAMVFGLTLVLALIPARRAAKAGDVHLLGRT